MQSKNVDVGAQGISVENQTVTVLSMTTQIVAAHLSNTEMPTVEIPEFIEVIQNKMLELSSESSGRTRQPPAIPISESVTPEYLFCLEDGKKFRMLKKHLRSYYNMSPEDYRAKWGLSPDYPMVAPNYAMKRQELAKNSGLGKKRG